MSKEFVGDDEGHVSGINIHRVEWTKSVSGGWDMKPVEGSDQFFPAQLVLLSMGFLGPENKVLGEDIELDPRKNVKTAPGQYMTNVPGVFAAGDCRRGQSLIVWYVIILSCFLFCLPRSRRIFPVLFSRLPSLLPFHRLSWHPSHSSFRTNRYQQGYKRRSSSRPRRRHLPHGRVHAAAQDGGDRPACSLRNHR